MQVIEHEGFKENGKMTKNGYKTIIGNIPAFKMGVIQPLILKGKRHCLVTFEILYGPMDLLLFIKMNVSGDH